jgi:hypothetical protein
MAEKPPAAPVPPAPSAVDPNIKLLADAIGEAIRQNRPKSVYAEAGFSPEQEAKLAELPKPQRHRKVPCRSEETGATFTACIVESRSCPAGRFVTLEDYRHPAGVMTYQSNGGLVPDGMQILRAGTAAPSEGAQIPKHDFNPYYLQWRWTEFYQRDLRRFAGKPLLASHAIDQAAFTRPWEEGTVGSLQVV